MRPPPTPPLEEPRAVGQLFRPLDPEAVPEIAAVIARLAQTDPDVLAAVADVDRSLIWAAMERGALEHLADCAAMMEDLTTLRDRAVVIEE